MKKEVTQSEIQSVVNHLVNRGERTEAKGLHRISDCPACGKAKHLYVNLGSGLWDCKRCEESGNIFRLADLLGVRVRQPSMVKSATSVMLSGFQTKFPKVKRRKTVPVDPVKAANVRLLSRDDDDARAVWDYLAGRGIEEDSIRHFMIGVAYLDREKTDVGFSMPYVDGESVVLMKMRNIAPSKEDRRFSRLKGCESSMFNIGGIRNRTRVVLVEGELDAISLWQCGVTAVASTSLGAKKTIPDAWVEELSDADEIVLWYDDDEAGQTAIVGLVESLGAGRISIAMIPESVSDWVYAKTGKHPTDANDLLKAGVAREEIQAIVKNAVTLEQSNVVRPSAFQDQLRGVVDMGDEALGIPIPCAPLQNLLRGWRPEVTVVTGHTGHGKTTWATDQMEKLAREGVPVLLSSLEDGPGALCRKIFQRRFMRPLSTIKTDEDRQRAYDAIDEIDRWPVYIVNRSGRVDFNAFKQDVLYAVRRLGVKVVLVDHLGYFQRDERISLVDHTDDIIISLKELADECGVSIHVIAHPNGSVPENVIPDQGSLKGSTGIKQNTANGISVFRSLDPMSDATAKPRKIKTPDGTRLDLEMARNCSLIMVWKKRHDEAETGYFVQEFNAGSLTFKDLKKEDDDGSDGDESFEADADLFSNFGF